MDKSPSDNYFNLDQKEQNEEEDSIMEDSIMEEENKIEEEEDVQL